MKKIGIVGGVGWRSTVDYYSEICRRSEQWQLATNPHLSPTTPEMSIESLDLKKAVAYIPADENEESWRQFDEYHNVALQRLEASGVDFALIASNTGHHRFTPIVRGIGIPVLSILDATAKECARIGASELLILGTPLTMRSATFREEFEKHGITAAGPRDDKLRAMTIALIAELQLGKAEAAAERLEEIVKRSFADQRGSRQAVCLACTELSLAFDRQKMLASFNRHGIRYINTTAAHIVAACELAFDGSEKV
jgi:aspartate racemase